MSDIAMCSVSFAWLPSPGVMVTLDEAGAAAIVSTGCATMISPECPGAMFVAMGIRHEFQVHVDVDCFPLVG